MVAREQARAATIMFLRCFFVFLFFYFFYYGRARASARSDHYVFALFFRIPFFLFFFFFLFSLYVGNLSCRKPRPTEMKFGR
jgi:hypothetical protein